MRMDLIYRRYDTDPTYLESEKWSKEFFEQVQDIEDIDSQAIYDLAREKYARLGNAREVIEKKAAGIILFVMTVTTVLSSTVVHGSLFHVSLVSLAASVISSLMVLFPCDWPASVSVRDALECCEYDQKKQCAQLAASLHCSIVAARLILDSKANWIACAYVTAIIGTALLTGLRIYLPTS